MHFEPLPGQSTQGRTKSVEDALAGDFIGKVVGVLAVYTVFFEVFGGAARYILAISHALFINNVPEIGAIVCFFGYFANCILNNRRPDKLMTASLAMVILFVVRGFFNDVPVGTAFFGFYIWSLFFLGILIAVYNKEEIIFRFLLFFWICTTVGVAINYFRDMPWVGFTYEVNGLKMEAAKKWWAEGGYVRLAGFTRASFSAAAIELLCTAYIITSTRYRLWFKAIVWIVSNVIIFLTTSKTDIIILLALPCVILVTRNLRFLSSSAEGGSTFFQFMVKLLTVLVIVLPISLVSMSVSGLDGQFLFFSAFSILDRIQRTWPTCFQILADHGNWITGRGIGGIGAPQVPITPVVPDLATTDNLFLYVLLSSGLIVVIPMFYGFFRNLKRIAWLNVSYFDVVCALTFCVLGLGITENVIEDPTLAVMTGFFMARGYRMPFINSETKY